MASSVKKSSAFNARQAALGDIRGFLTKIRIAADPLARLDAAPSSLTAKVAPPKQPMFDVIIQFHRSFPGSSKLPGRNQHRRVDRDNSIPKGEKRPQTCAKLDNRRAALPAEKTWARDNETVGCLAARTGTGVGDRNAGNSF